MLQLQKNSKELVAVQFAKWKVLAFFRSMVGLTICLIDSFLTITLGSCYLAVSVDLQWKRV